MRNRTTNANSKIKLGAKRPLQSWLLIGAAAVIISLVAAPMLSNRVTAASSTGGFCMQATSDESEFVGTSGKQCDSDKVVTPAPEEASLKAVSLSAYAVDSFQVGVLWDSTLSPQGTRYRVLASINGGAFEQIGMTDGSYPEFRFDRAALSEIFGTLPDGFKGELVVDYELGTTRSLPSAPVQFEDQGSWGQIQLSQPAKLI